jgi:phosphoenolpyruvate carboxykinase (ATP)
MVNHTQNKKTVNLDQYGIKNATIRYQLSADELHNITLENKLGKESSTGALAINTGEFTGRSPMDRFIVKDEITKDRVWWGNINLEFDADKFQSLYEKVTTYLSEKEVFVRDSYACADEDYKLNIRVINEYPWSNMFAHNMFLRPTNSELENFSPEWTVINAPGFMADPAVDGTRQHNFAILDFTRKTALIGELVILVKLRKVFSPP